MARPLDYNKWNNIEVSDDEDDTHPNIDTPSLFKWRHEARVKRMEEMDAKKKFVTDEKKKKEQEIEALKKKNGHNRALRIRNENHPKRFERVRKRGKPCQRENERSD